MSEPIKIGDLLDSITTAREVKRDQFTDALNAALTVGIQQTDLSRLAIAAVGNPGGEELLEWLITSGIGTDEIDSAVATAFQVTESHLEWLPASSRTFSLPRTHALSVDVSDSVAAWNEQIMLKPRSPAAEDALALRTGPDGVIAAALSITDRDLTTRAATAVLSDTTLLEGHSVSEARFRDIWFSAVELGVDPWAVVEPTMAVTPLLDLLVAGKPVESEILVSLSRTTAADICHYSARSQLWDLLPSNASAGFKSATAGTFARTYSPGDRVPERQLQDAILSTPLLESVSRESSAQAIALLRGMPSSHAQHAVLVATHGRFNPHEESALASLVVERRWQLAVEPILRLSSTRPDLLSAARRVSSLLGFWDRLLLNATAGYSPTHTISTSDLNSGLQEIAAELYPTGPKEGGIWARAGGHEADLPVAHTGRLAWGQALQGTQEGRRGSATPSGLVDGMLEDFPHNLKLKNLKALLTKGFEYDRTRR